MIQSVIDQMVYFAYFQCILLAIIYIFSSKNRKRINPFLAIFVVVLIVGLTSRVVYLSGVFGYDNRLMVFSELATLFFGSTVYLFTRSSLTDQKYSHRNLYHYILPVVYGLIVSIVFIILHQQSKPMWVTLLLVGFGLLVNIIYYIQAVKVFVDFKKRIQNELSHAVKSKFFQIFLISIGCCLLIWTGLFVMGNIDISYLPKTSWQLIWFCIAIVILVITYYGIQDPELYKIDLPVEEPKSQKYAHSKFSEKDLDRLKTELEQIMQEKKPYLNQKLLKSELAELMGVSNPEMARLLNERIGMNYFEFVNYYRIKEFIELAKTDKAQELSVFGLAQESGFYSKTTFNKSFKQLMGMTPTAYFDKSKD